MSRFNTETLAAMRAALAEVCSHIPQHSPDARAFVILESAYQGEKTYDGLLQVGRRAVIEQFGSVNVVESALRR